MRELNFWECSKTFHVNELHLLLYIMWVLERFHRNALLSEGGGGPGPVVSFPDQDNLSLTACLAVLTICLFT